MDGLDLTGKPLQRTTFSWFREPIARTWPAKLDLRRPIALVVGIEIDADLASRASENLRHVKHVEVIHDEAGTTIPAQATRSLSTPAPLTRNRSGSIADESLSQVLVCDLTSSVGSALKNALIIELPSFIANPRRSRAAPTRPSSPFCSNLKRSTRPIGVPSTLFAALSSQ